MNTASTQSSQSRESVLPQHLRKPRIIEQSTATEWDIWESPQDSLWKLERIQPRPFFYPIYRWRDYYSYSPLPLILHKASLCVDQALIEQRNRIDLPYYCGARTIDTEVRRIGGCDRRRLKKSKEPAASAIARALVSDIQAYEERWPERTNIVLCGGRDSLNLLLLPWKNPVVALSARPNYPLVQDFVRENRLDIPVVEAVHEETTRRLEILANGCAMDLSHVRWNSVLTRMASEMQNHATFWCGTLADVFMTPYWRRYEVQKVRKSQIVTRFRKKYFPGSYAMEMLWKRGAMWQGMYHSIAMLCCGCPVLSGYHGPNMREFFTIFEIEAIDRDIRAEMGGILRGGTVHYPSSNPSPPPIQGREQIDSLQNFTEEFSQLGIPMQNA